MRQLKLKNQSLSKQLSGRQEELQKCKADLKELQAQYTVHEQVCKQLSDAQSALEKVQKELTEKDILANKLQITLEEAELKLKSVETPENS